METQFHTAWEIHTKGLRQLLAHDLETRRISGTDIVWTGPDGSVAVATTPYDLEDSEYDEYVDSGQVSEYLDE